MTEAEEAELRQKAQFCLILRIAPSEYDAMDDDEIEMFLDVHAEMIRNRE